VSPVAKAWAKGEKKPSLETLLRTAVQNSDNTSGDKLVTFNGGGSTITAQLRAMDIEHVVIAEQEIEIAGRTQCPGVAAPPGGWLPAAIRACGNSSTDARLSALRKEISEPPNWATSDGLAGMLLLLDRGDILSEPSRNWLTAALQGTSTGKTRIKAGLPEGTRVGHKTGTGDTVDGLNVATNDIGIVYLPTGARVVVSVLTSGVPGTTENRDALIAGIARDAYDAFSR
jgi:beta-lactamase class A